MSGSSSNGCPASQCNFSLTDACNSIATRLVDDAASQIVGGQPDVRPTYDHYEALKAERANLLSPKLD